MAIVLLVDDRAENRQTLGTLLTKAGYEVQDAADMLGAIARVRARPTDVVVSDVRMDADDDGLNLLRTIKSELPQLPVILYSGFPDVDDAILAIKLGAVDYLQLPVDPDQFLGAIQKAVETRRSPVGALDPNEPPYGIVAVSPAMRSLLQWIERIGGTNLTVLLIGETGTGKEVIARALHATSERRTRSFIPVNCGAIPDGLFEAELFGYRRGAFTGALMHKPGLLEEAHCGTLLLDEIGELPIDMQVRLLRFLEGGEVRRIGETKVRYVDVRVIAATNRNLQDEIASGRFRADLYYRLGVTKCVIPPLRERLADLEPLIDFWLYRLASRAGSRVPRISGGALALLRAHSWPGNVRELRSLLEHVISLLPGDEITEQEVARALGTQAVAPGNLSHGSEEEQRTQLLTALGRHHWKLGRTASSLGINRSTLWRRLRKYGIRATE